MQHSTMSISDFVPALPGDVDHAGVLAQDDPQWPVGPIDYQLRWRLLEFLESFFDEDQDSLAEVATAEVTFKNDEEQISGYDDNEETRVNIVFDEKAVDDYCEIPVVVRHITLPDYDEVAEDGGYFIPNDIFSPSRAIIHHGREIIWSDIQSMHSSCSSLSSLGSLIPTRFGGCALEEPPFSAPRGSSPTRGDFHDDSHNVPALSYSPEPGPYYPVDASPTLDAAPYTGITPAPSPSGISLHHFDIIRIIGKGSEGFVYHLEHKALKTKHALKAVLDVYDERGDERKTGQVGWLREEQGILKGLINVDGFVQLEASWNDTKNFYFLSPLYATDLENEIKRCGRIPNDRSQFYFAQLVIAIQTLHARGIIHRDIKPSNLMIDFEGHLVVGDFGLSEDFGVEPTIEERTYQPYWPYWGSDVANEETPHRPLETLPYILNSYCGSPPHMAPEIWLKQPYSFPIDWWAAATCLYNMVTGRYPFWVSKEEVGKKLVDKVTTEDLEFFRFDMIDEVTQDICRRMLMKKPEERLPVLDIESHEYFRGIDWDAMRRRGVAPPYVPPEIFYVSYEPIQPFARGDEYEPGMNPYRDFEYLSPALHVDAISSNLEILTTKNEMEGWRDADALRSSKRRLTKLWKKVFRTSQPLVLSMRSPSFFSPDYCASAPQPSFHRGSSVGEAAPNTAPPNQANGRHSQLERMRTRMKHIFIPEARPLPPNSPRLELD